MTIAEAYDDFMYDQHVKNNSEATITFYTTFLGNFVEWVTRQLTNVEELTIKQYKDYVIYLSRTDLKPSSVNCNLRAVKAFYNYLIDDDVITDCSRKLKLIKQTKQEIIPLSDEEIHTLLSCFDTSNTLELRNKCITLLMLDCGLRRAEVCRLRMVDVDFGQSSLLVNGKGDKQRLVPMGDTTRAALIDYSTLVSDKRPKSELSPFFLDRFGGGIDDNVVKMLFQDLKTRTGIARLHPHLLRHTFATLYLVDGGDLEVLRCILGHSSISITQIYLHLSSNYQLIRSKHNSHIDNLIKK